MAVLWLWAALALAASIKTVVTPELHTVFPKLAARAVDWWTGQPLYAKHDGLGRFPYSPTFAIALTPFALLGNTVGGIAWTWLNITVYVGGLRRLARDVLPGEWPPAREAALLGLAMIGAVRGVWSAQHNALIIGLLMLAASAIARRRWWLAASLLAAPLFLKVWAVAIALLLVAARPKPLAGRFAVLLLVGAALPFATARPGWVVEQYHNWFAYMGAMSEDVICSYRDLWTVLRTLEIPVDVRVYRAVQALTGLASRSSDSPC